MPLDVSQFLSGLEGAHQKQMAAAVKAIDDYAEHVLGDAQQLCPVDIGTLQGSGKSEPIQVEGSSISKKIGFNTDYAAAVHENMEAHHTRGQAKYLSTAMSNNAGKLGPFIAQKTKDAG